MPPWTCPSPVPTLPPAVVQGLAGTRTSARRLRSKWWVRAGPTRVTVTQVPSLPALLSVGPWPAPHGDGHGVGAPRVRPPVVSELTLGA